MTTTTTELTVSELTATRLERLVELEATIGRDSLVNLALDAYLILASIGTPAYTDATPTTAAWLERLNVIRDGSHYCELVGKGAEDEELAQEALKEAGVYDSPPEPGFVTRWRAEYEPDSLDEAIVDAILADPLAALGDVQKVLFVLAGLTTYAAVSDDGEHELAEALSEQDGAIFQLAASTVSRFKLWLRYPEQHPESYLRDA